jgi:F-type H+-transporting ATPase subunit b
MRRGLMMLVLGLTLGALLSVSSSSWAQEHPPTGGGTAAQGHEDSSDKIPFGDRALDLTLWTIVVFLLLLFVLGKYAWGPLLQALEAREHNIHSALEEAQKAREESQQLREQLQKEVNRSQEMVRDLIDQGRRDAQHAAEEILNKARGEVQTERDRLHREIELARDQALQQIWGQTAQLATLVSSKVIRRQLNPDDHRQLVDEALAELHQSGVDAHRIVSAS